MLVCVSIAPDIDSENDLATGCQVWVAPKVIERWTLWGAGMVRTM